MTDLRRRMLEDLQLGGYSNCTTESYVGSVAAFARYHKKSPALCGREDVRNWAMYLQTKGLSSASVRLRLSGLKFFYARTLGSPEVMADLPLPKPRKKMPVVLSESEVHALLDALETPRMRIFLRSSMRQGCVCARPAFSRHATFKKSEASFMCATARGAKSAS